jgi:hypothetical protein
MRFMANVIIVPNDDEHTALGVFQRRLRRAAESDSWEEVFDFARGILDLPDDDTTVRAAKEDARAWMTVAERRLGWESRVARDQQTGKVYVIRHEDRWSTALAAVSLTILLLSLLTLAYALIDVWTHQYALLRSLGFRREDLDTELFRLLAYTGIAGAIGGATNSFRSLVAWHCEAHAYGRRFFWKDVASPLIGGLVGIFVYVLLRTGTGAVNGDLTLDRENGLVVLAAFGVAFLAGFCWHQVFKWLDDLFNRSFRTGSPTEEVEVPDIVGLPYRQARQILAERQLHQGSISGVDWSSTADLSSLVIKQSPVAGTRVERGSRVDIALTNQIRLEAPA